MKKNYHYAIAFMAIAIGLILWKTIPNHSQKKRLAPSSAIIDDDAQQANSDTARLQAKNIIHTPKGTLRYAKMKPSYDMVNHFIESGFIDVEYQKWLARLRPNSWKVFLDEKNHVIKFQIREVVTPTVNNDVRMLNFIEEHYIITAIGSNKVSMEDKETMKNLYLSLQVNNSFLENNTQEFSGAPNLQEVEIYPVLAQYQGLSNPELRESDKNFSYLEGKDLPMLLIKSNKGTPNKEDRSTSTDEGRAILYKYGMEDCREVEWQLLPFPRNEEEVKFYTNSPDPDSIGTGARFFTPTVAAWERVHGKKYVEK